MKREEVTKEVLEDLLITKRMTYVEAATVLGIPKGSLHGLIKKLNVDTTKFPRYKKNLLPEKSQIERLLAEGKSKRQIAKILNVDGYKVSKVIRDENIDMSNYKKHPLANEKENLIRLLIKEKKTYEEVGKIYNLSPGTVKWAAEKIHNINISEREPNHEPYTKEDLERYIFKEELPYGAIAKIYGVSNGSCIRAAAKRLGIQLKKRTGKDAPQSWRKYKKEDLEKYIFEEHLTCTEIGQKYYGGVSRSSILSAINKFGIVLPNSRTNFKPYTPSNFKYEGTLLPVPLDLANKFYKIQLTAGLTNFNSKIYVPELNRVCHGLRDVKRDLELRNINYYSWESRWILGIDSRLTGTRCWAEARTDMFYPNKKSYKKTREYIIDQFLLDKDFKFKGYILRDDFIDEYNKSRNSSDIFVDYDFSPLPEIIQHSNDKFSLKFKWKNITGVFRCSYQSLVLSRSDAPEISKIKAELHSSTGPSKGEKLVAEYLGNREILYESQKIVNNNISLKSKKFVVIDFSIVLNGIEYWIEYNGLQHYEYTKWFYKDERHFKSQLQRDRDIRRYCKRTGIVLIEIPYTFKSIESISNLLDKILFDKISPDKLIDYKSLYK